MKRRKVFRFAVILGLLFGTTVIIFALTSLFYTQSIKTNLNKKTVFQFNLNTELQDLEVGPGDSLVLNHQYIMMELMRCMYLSK